MKYTEEEIQQIESLCRDLLHMNEDLNAKIIAMNAKLENEERKVKRLIAELYFLQNPSKYTA